METARVSETSEFFKELTWLSAREEFIQSVCDVNFLKVWQLQVFGNDANKLTADNTLGVPSSNQSRISGLPV
jgi:hypothetical protein